MKLLTPIALILIAGAGFYFYINPQYAVVKELEKERDQYIEAVDQAKEAADRLGVLVDELNSYTTEDLQRLRRLLPDNVDSIRMLIDVQALSKEYNVKLENVKCRIRNVKCRRKAQGC